MNFLVSRQAVVAREAAAAVTPTGKVLRLAEYAVLESAQALLAQMHQQTAAMPARLQDAYETSRLQGYQEGREAALKEQAGEMLRLHRLRSRFIADVEHQMVELVMSAVRKIVADFDDDGRIYAVVRGALAVVRAQQRVLLKVHQADAATLRNRTQALLAGYPGIDCLDVAEDDRIARGTCRLETDAGAVAAGIECQLQALREAFERALDAGGPGNHPAPAGIVQAQADLAG